MKAIELLTVMALSGIATAGIVGGAYGLMVGIPALMGIEAKPVPMEQRPPIQRGTATHDGHGQPWTHDLNGRPLTDPPVPASRANVAYRGWPYGQ